MKCRRFGLSILLVSIISISGFGADAGPGIPLSGDSAPVFKENMKTDGNVPADAKENEAQAVSNKDASIPGASSVVPVAALTAVSKNNEKRGRDKASRYIGKAIEAYNNGLVSDADELATTGLGMDAENKVLIQLKSRINRVQAERTKIADRLTWYASHSLGGGNFMEALIQVRKAVLIDSGNSNAAALFMAITEKIENDTNIQNVKDTANIKKAVKYILKENYKASIGILRKLEPYYPQAGEYLNVVSAHTSDAENRRRADIYCGAARKMFAGRRYREAEQDVLLALAIEDTNVDALILKEQLAIETEPK